MKISQWWFDVILWWIKIFTGLGKLASHFNPDLKIPLNFRMDSRFTYNSKFHMDSLHQQPQSPRIPRRIHEILPTGLDLIISKLSLKILAKNLSILLKESDSIKSGEVPSYNNYRRNGQLSLQKINRKLFCSFCWSENSFLSHPHLHCCFAVFSSTALNLHYQVSQANRYDHCICSVRHHKIMIPWRASHRYLWKGSVSNHLHIC